MKSGVSFAEKAGGNKGSDDEVPNVKNDEDSIRESFSQLCPFYMVSGNCQRSTCTYIHGDLCDMCQLACLHPTDENQRNSHIKVGNLSNSLNKP